MIGYLTTFLVDGNIRPVVVLKPFTDALYEMLIDEFPGKFDVPVPREYTYNIDFDWRLHLIISVRKGVMFL